jgi:hypothetical protein
MARVVKSEAGVCFNFVRRFRLSPDRSDSASVIATWVEVDFLAGKVPRYTMSDIGGGS